MTEPRLEAESVGPTPERPVDVNELADTLKSMSPAKQMSVLELWPAIEVEIEDGLTVTAKSKKELRRFTRPKDPSMLEWLRRFDADEVFYDIGANCGSLTLAAGAMHRGRIKVVAIEPSFSSFESLTRNLSQNDMLDFTIPLQMALLDRTGVEPMNYASTVAGTSSHAVGEPVDFNGKKFTPVDVQMMPTFALDDLIEALGLPLPTRMKIDVDGVEHAVLSGATETLTRGTIKEVAVEISDPDRAGTKGESIRRLFEDHGYDLATKFLHGDQASRALQPGETADFLFARGDLHRRGSVAWARNAGVTEVTPRRNEPTQGERTVGHEPVARQTHEMDTLKSELEALKAELESSRDDQQTLRSELAELRSSHFLSGAKKKLDIREVDGFAQAAQRVRSSGRASMDYDRLYTLWQAVRSAPPGYPVVEVGTYRGGSARFISETLQAGDQSPRFYVCDTFAGHPRTDPDIDTAHHGSHKFGNASAADTAEYLSGYHNLEMLVGDIVETSSQLADESFGFVHVDVDVYPATDHCLRFFAPRLADGALILVDDYGFVTCPGVRVAADAFIAEFPEFRLLHLLTGQAVLSRR